MRNVVIAGVGMTPFGRSPGVGIRAMATAASAEALKDAGVPADRVGKIFFGNAVAPTVTQQDMIKGQVAFRGSELAGLPVINIENACASGSSAVHLGVQAIAGGHEEIVLAVGAEQLTHEDKVRSFKALRGSTDIYEIGEAPQDQDWTKSILMDFYAAEAASFLDRTDATTEDLARVAVKNRRHASLNPLAQFRAPQTVEQVLASRMIAPPLTLSMCSPMTDGAAAVVLCTEEYARANGIGALLRVLGCELKGGRDVLPVTEVTAAVTEAAGVGVPEAHLIELHDAAAPAELLQYGEIGLCPAGEETRLIRGGDTGLGGRIPVNTSGGLMSRGHALGATGIAQIVEVATQLRGRAGDRQVEGAGLGLAVNTGGWMGGGYAVAVATILEALR
ncbi:thiolase family protein [Amycolatopsis sp.]|uniref:thiolase family protein n=1 Tax=Amycolatopsis sp. TaxID=37632 RepID=UPI002C176D65|nr:thiolase family protein [Amycolatopsis sp.]HVV08253.1 thiolase family protein [Amycolatopsis sp.]